MKEEWYTYDKSPRNNVHVLASVNESSYVPDSNIKMGDHPVVWTNEHFPARNIYIFMGHGPDLLRNKFYTTLLTNAIFWAGKKDWVYSLLLFFNTFRVEIIYSNERHQVFVASGFTLHQLARLGSRIQDLKCLLFTAGQLKKHILILPMPPYNFSKN